MADNVGCWAEMRPEWFQGDEGRRVLTNILSWQADDGAWPKNQDNSAAPADIPRDRISGTFDNGATLGELRVPETRQETGPDGKRVVPAPGAMGLWPRFCEYGSNRPIFCGRDGVIRHSLAEVPRERRDGYAWYGDWGQSVETRWKKWSRERSR